MELFDVLDGNGEKTGEVKLRSLVHKDGDWHKAVHIWITNDKGQLLMQKRSPNKDSHPNEWDISCAGHVVAGETSASTAVKELSEELGLTASENDFEFLFQLKNQSITNNGSFLNNEFDDVYIIKLDSLDIAKLNSISKCNTRTR
jgi:isopentenyldiphosphate isomerase